MSETLSKSRSTRTQGRSAVDIIDEEVASGKRVLTPLGKKMLEGRRAIEASDIPLLTEEELELEKAERRAGVEVPFVR
jgi:hypothetical protein